jgi:hypothetical protein
MRIKLTLCLLLFSSCLFAQIMVARPYLKISDIDNGYTYKVNKLRQFKSCSTVSDSVVRDIEVEWFNKHGLMLKDGSFIPYKEIRYLRVRTVNKAKTPFRLLSYTAYLTLTTAFLVSLADCGDPGCGGMELLPVVLLPFWILGTETVALTMQASTPISGFYKGGMIIEYVGFKEPIRPTQPGLFPNH